MMINKNITYTTRNYLCTGCGICVGVCPTNSIIIECIKGEYIPSLNKSTCLGDKCGRCLKVCPGIGCDLTRLAEKYFSGEAIKDNMYIGRYLSTYTGYSNDGNIRYHSASGGMISQFLIYMLEKGIIDGAVVTRFSKENPLKPEPFIARTKEEILQAKSSKYCPVAFDKVGDAIVENKGRYVIVGLPCHVQGFRKRARIDREFEESVIGYFAIYCSSNRTFNAQDYLFKKYDAKKGNITYFAYRDNGCLGNMVIKQQTQYESESLISVPFIRYYGSLRSFFKPRRCLTCIDHYGELADVCFGDIHIKPYSDDTIGINSCIVRNDYFNILLNQAVTDGYITLNNVDAQIINESQKAMLYPKKRKANALMKIDKYVLHKDVAKYDVELDQPTVKDYLSVIATNIQRYIGRHRIFWFLIKIWSKK